MNKKLVLIVTAVVLVAVAATYYLHTLSKQPEPEPESGSLSNELKGITLRFRLSGTKTFFAYNKSYTKQVDVFHTFEINRKEQLDRYEEWLEEYHMTWFMPRIADVQSHVSLQIIGSRPLEFLVFYDRELIGTYTGMCELQFDRAGLLRIGNQNDVNVEFKVEVTGEVVERWEPP